MVIKNKEYAREMVEKKKQQLLKKFNSKTRMGILIAVCLISLLTSPFWFSTVKKGTYQIKQTAFFGNMYAKMDPGIWWQLFGSIDVWPKAFTFYFTHDNDEGARHDQSIEVRFVDGSKCNISGTARVHLPSTKKEAIFLVTDESYSSVEDLELKLILPTIRNVLRLTANMMTAQESYASKRIDYNNWARDQIENGLYITEDEVRQIKDLVSGEMVYKTFKVIKEDKNGNPLYHTNPLAGLDIQLRNFEIKSFEYAPKVKEQIAKQQESLMAVATAKADAQKAEQQKLTIEAEGKAKVAKAKYEEEQVKVRAVVLAQKEKEVQELNAERDKQVALIGAQKRQEVAKKDRLAAEDKKKEQILLGQGEAERKRLVMSADGALQQKLKTLEKIHKVWASAHSERQVPSVLFGGGGSGNPDNNTLGYQDAISIMALKQLGLDLSIPNKK